MGQKRNGYNILVGKPERKRPLGRPRCRWQEGKLVRVLIGCIWLRIGTCGGDL
jgi:hypothetical protein